MAIEGLVIPDGWRESQLRSLRNKLKGIEVKIELLTDERSSTMARIAELTSTTPEEG